MAPGSSRLFDPSTRLGAPPADGLDLLYKPKGDFLPTSLSPATTPSSLGVVGAEARGRGGRFQLEKMVSPHELGRSHRTAAPSAVAVRLCAAVGNVLLSHGPSRPFLRGERVSSESEEGSEESDRRARRFSRTPGKNPGLPLLDGPRWARDMVPRVTTVAQRSDPSTHCGGAAFCARRRVVAPGSFSTDAAGAVRQRLKPLPRVVVTARLLRCVRPAPNWFARSRVISSMRCRRLPMIDMSPLVSSRQVAKLPPSVCWLEPSLRSAS